MVSIGAVHVDLVANPTLLRQLWMNCLAQGDTSELSGLGEVEVSGTQINVCGPMHLLPQTGSMARTVLSPKEVGRLLTRLALAGQDHSRVRFWYHTHPGMPAFFSQTDENTIAQLSEMFTPFVAGVFNSEGDCQWRVVTAVNEVTFEYTIPPEDRPTEEEIEAAKLIVNPLVKVHSWREELKDFDFLGFGFHGWKRKGRRR